MDQDVEQRGLAREMYQSSQEVVHVSTEPQTPLSHVPKKHNRFVWVLIAVVLMGISVGIAGGYYLTTHAGLVFPMFLSEPTPTPQPVNRTAAIVQKELQGFPSYPGATYIKKETVPPCTEEVSGYSICDAVTYTWETNDPVEKVQLSYREIVEKIPGWKFTGSAGSIGSGSVHSYSNNSFLLRAHISATSPDDNPSRLPTTIIIEVPRIEERMQKESWKTYKTEIGVSLKIPQDIIVEDGEESVSFYLDEATKQGSGITIYTRNIAFNEGIDVQGRELKETFSNGYKATYIADNPETLKDYWIYSSDRKQVVRVTISTVGEAADKQQDAMQIYTDMLSTIQFE